MGQRLSVVVMPYIWHGLFFSSISFLKVFKKVIMGVSWTWKGCTFCFLFKGKDDVYMEGMTLCRLLRFRNV